MASFHEDVVEYRKQLQTGTIRNAYRGLMEYIMSLRTHFERKYPDCFTSGSIYYGYMDMTYFSVIPESLKRRKLKIAVVFLHEPCRFEVWLSGGNKRVQREYWTLFRESGWNRYHLVPDTKGMDSIVEHVLVEKPNFDDLESLTERIDKATMIFIEDMNAFLKDQPLPKM